MSTKPVPFSAAVPARGRVPSNLIDATARVLAVAVLVTLILARFRPLQGAALQAIALSIAAASAVQFANRPRRLELALTLMAAAGVALFYISLGWTGVRLAPVSIILAASLGVGTILVLGAKAAYSTAYLKTFLLAAFCPVMVVFTTVFVAVAAGWQPLVFDGHLYRFEGSLGFQPAFLLGQAFLRWHPLYVVALWVYGSLPLALVLMFIVMARRPAGRLAPAVTAVVLTAMVGFALYQVCPAIGPAYRFPHNFPFHPPANVPVAIEPAGLDNLRNAMPSLHIAWAFVLCWNLRRERLWVGVSAAAYFLVMVMATMGFGEHYAVDLVVGLALALAVQSCAVRHRSCAVAAFALVGAWLIYFRCGVPLLAPVAPFGWIPVLASLALCVVIAVKLHGWETLATAARGRGGSSRAQCFPVP
jgi:hypothetical protein